MLMVTIGQYLQPSKKHLPVKEFITPDQFAIYEKYGLELDSSRNPLVRSSYKAAKHIL
jgi:lipoic acid synthetase